MRRLLAPLLALALASPLLAQEPAPGTEPPPQPPASGAAEPAPSEEGAPPAFPFVPHLSSAIPALRDGRAWLAERGLTFELVYTGEGWINTRGGVTTHKARIYRGDISFSFELETEKAGLWPGGTFLFHAQEQHGSGLTDYTGDFQVISNLEADQFSQVSTAAYRQSFFEERIWLQLGKQDANDTFAASEHGASFLHSSPGFPPTIPLASFPDPEWGVLAGFDTDYVSLALGAFQGDINGGRSVGQSFARLRGPTVLAELTLHSTLLDRRGDLRLGCWWSGEVYDELDRSDPDPGRFGHSHGYYATLDQWLWVEAGSAPGEEQGLAIFLQYAWSPPDRSEAAQYLGGGLRGVGLIPTRDADECGLGVFHVEFSRQLNLPRSNETAFELFYTALIFDWLRVTGDAQLILNPGGTTNREVIALGLRFEVSL